MPGKRTVGTATATAGIALVSLALASCQTMSQYSVNPHEYSGVRLYQVYCSSCHGLTARGDGPVAALVRGGVPDLTRIAERRGGQFPNDSLARKQADAAVTRLVEYLRTIQPGYYYR